MVLLALGCGLYVVRPIAAQAPAGAPAQEQKPAPKTPGESNPFPEDTTNVPVMPNSDTPASPGTPAPGGAADVPMAPAADADPVRSPEEPIADDSSTSGDSSSSLRGLPNLLPPPDTETKPRRGKQQAPEHQETAAEDVNVGKYYLSNRNWKAASSRFESALVLDPENPEVYWGLAEAQRHLGEYANAKANYQKVLDYDPDGKHAKEAKKILKSAELANPPAASAVRSASPTQ